MPPSPANRKRAERFGHAGELLAEAVLRLQFYRIRARRFKTPLGEIDLIARRGRTLVFVEVKTRKSGQGIETAMAAVNTSRIVRAAQWYLARHPRLAAYTIRFDVIFLAPFAWPYHVRGAFMDRE